MKLSEKAIYNREYDKRNQYRANTLSRKPGSTKAQREALKARVAERKANGTLGKVPFVLEAVSNPYLALNGRWAVSMELSDGIIRRVPEVRFDDKGKALDYQKHMQANIGQEVEGGRV